MSEGRKMAKTVTVKEVRRLIADYMKAEGCSCCRSIDAHEAAKEKLAKLLGVPHYSDGQGYNFYRFASKREARRG